MKKLYHILLIPVILSPIYSHTQYCTSGNRFTEEEFFTESQLSSAIDVTYATNVLDYQGNVQNLEMDLYFPSFANETLANRPFIMLIHGGGFQNGSRTELIKLCKGFAQRGFVAATIDYRLGWNNQNYAIYRAQQDANAAMRYIVENADIYGIDINWMFLGGQSAGAVTSLNTNYMTQAEWEAETPGITTLLGALYTSGNNLTNLFDLKGIFNNWGGTAGSAIQSNEMIPMISFHGALDNTIPLGINGDIYGSKAIHDLLLINNVCSEITVEPMGGHGVHTSDSGGEFRVSRASCFFKSLFCNSCSSLYQTDSTPPNCSNTLSINKLNDHDNSFQLFPNPVENDLTIIGDLANCNIKILNISGVIIRTTISSSNNSYITDISDLENGIYVLKINDQKTHKVKYLKFIKR